MLFRSAHANVPYFVALLQNGSEKSIRVFDRLTGKALTGFSARDRGAMSVQLLPDGRAILKGSDTAATTYLRQTTSAALTMAFRPVIERSLEKTEATRHWKEVFDAYNKFPTTFKKVNADLPANWSASRSRPLCAYPKVARYKGSGSLDDAASFSCQ